jgi:deazaflavin-dependent oxidoreductase (nitroreductase family)
MSGAPIALGDVSPRVPGVTRRAAAAHGALFRRTRGRLMSRWFGSGILVLQTIGRRTGAVRTAPLVYLPDGDDLVVVPANAGAPRPPAWWLNLRAAGEAVADLGGERRTVRPVIASGADHERLWRRFAAVAPVEHYRRRAARHLPVVRLTPVSHGSLRARPYNRLIHYQGTTP